MGINSLLSFPVCLAFLLRIPAYDIVMWEQFCTTLVRVGCISTDLHCMALVSEHTQFKTSFGSHLSPYHCRASSFTYLSHSPGPLIY